MRILQDYRGENVTIDILERICKTLDCSLDDIVEFVPDEKKQAPEAKLSQRKKERKIASPLSFLF